jgi:hypothetical protein
MTQNLKQDQMISAELAMNLASCAETNLRHIRDRALLQFLLDVTLLDDKSIVARIFKCKEVMQIVADAMGLSVVVPK